MTKRRRFTPEFKKQAVEMVENGRSVPEVAVELEIEASCLYSWRRRNQAPDDPDGTSEYQVPGTPEGNELLTLRRENTILRRENDILKKAAIILGTDPSFRTGK